MHKRKVLPVCFQLYTPLCHCGLVTENNFKKSLRKKYRINLLDLFDEELRHLIRNRKICFVLHYTIGFMKPSVSAVFLIMISLSLEAIPKDGQI